MIPEITIKISFAPTPGASGVEATVTALDIAPPELPGEPAGAQIPAPPQIDDDATGVTFGAEVPPPPAAMTFEEEVPPLPTSDAAEDSSESSDEPPPTPKRRNRRQAE